MGNFQDMRRSSSCFTWNSRLQVHVYLWQLWVEGTMVGWLARTPPKDVLLGKRLCSGAQLPITLWAGILPIMIFSLLVPLSSSEQNSQCEYSLDPWVKWGGSVRPRSNKADPAEGAAGVPRAPALKGSQSPWVSSQPGCGCALCLDTCSSALLV